MKSILLAFKEAPLVYVRRRDGVIVVALQLAATICELLGFMSFVPVFQYLNARGDVASLAQDHTHWRVMKDGASAIGIDLSLGVLLVVTLSFLMSRQVLTLARTLFEHGLRESATARLRGMLFRRFLWVSCDGQDRLSSGGFVSDLTLHVSQALLHIFARFGLLSQIIIAVVYVAGMLLVSPVMTGVLLAVVGLAAAVAAPQVLKARRLGKELVSANRNVSEFVLERLKLVRLVRLARMEEPEASEIKGLAEMQRRALYGMWRLIATTDALIETIAVCAGLLVVYLSVSWIGAPIELVGLFLGMLLRLLPVVQQLAKTKQSIDSNRAAFDTVVLRMRELEAGRERSEGWRQLSRPSKAITFSAVSYTYRSRPDAPVLRDVSLTIPARKMTAIVGPSGSGKSTLVDLLPRLRIPEGGRIEIDGVDIREFELDSLRKGIAYLSQSPLIFNVTLREHITYGAREATQSDIERATRLAGAHSFIAALPRGYDTPAGDGGKALSGGQRQRLDLARALLSRAPILILDEPTANLDAQSERAFRDALDRIRAETDTTVIVIAHRLATVESADQIVVLEQGRVTGAATHAELMRTNTWYRSSFTQIAPLEAAQ